MLCNDTPKTLGELFAHADDCASCDALLTADPVAGLRDTALVRQLAESDSASDYERVRLW